MTQKTIAHRYVLNDELGSGGMGTVYRGTDTDTNQTIAIKHLKPQIARPEMIERFKREGEALRELNHPNIVKMLDAVEDEGEHYLVMEFVSGGDLKNLLETSGKLNYKRCVNLAIDLADALTRAHRLNIIHRDLKPANILIGEDGVLRLTDFGVAHMGNKERVTDTNAVVGTVDYLSPEALRGESIDNRSDIWAFGVMLFEMLAGRRPFKGGSLTETIFAILTAPLPDLEVLSPDVPIALVDLIYRMLERDPQSRMSSVRHVGATLEDILHGRTSQQPITRRFDTPLQDIVLSVKHNLPAQTTPFVGREVEVDALIRLLNNSANRLITIIAPGGMGKTRLSLEVASHEIENFQHGVFFVELAPLTHAADIITAVAEALGYQLQLDGRDTKQQVLDFLHQKSLLLIFDNFEHLLDGADVVTDILKHAPEVKILATSRQRLNQSGETLYHLSGMPFSELDTVADALQNGAVQLFLQSARRVRPDFELTEHNLTDIALICKQVQGMPLGIILSAGWLALLTPAEIVEEIVSGLDFFDTEATDLPDRQRSIRIIFDYSWESMTADEQQVFMKLSIFRGGFSRQAAQEVTGATLQNLMSLVNKSLIRRDAVTGRYDIHELLRQYAEQQLSSHDLTEATRQAHSAFFVGLAQQAERELRYANQEYWFRMLSEEHDNLRVALSWSTEHQIEDAFKIMASSRDFWFYQGHHLEAYTWMSKIKEQADLLDDVAKGRLLYSMGIIAWALQKTDEAEQLAHESIALLQNSGNKQYFGWALVMLVSVIGVKDGRYEKAMELSEQARQIFVEIDDKAGLAQLYNIIGNAHEFVEQYDLAWAEFERSIAVAKVTGENRRIAMNQANLARLSILRGDYRSGLELMKRTIKMDYQIGFQYMLLFDLNGFAQLLAEVNRPYEALLMLSANAALGESLGIKIQPADYVWWERTSEQVRNQLDDEQYDRAWTQGQDMSFKQAMDYALNIELDD